MSLNFDNARLKNEHLMPHHDEWRTQLRRFFEKEIIPYADDWDETGLIPNDLWSKSAEVGILGLDYPEEFGGTSEGIDIWHKNILNEELARIAVGGIGATLMVHNIALPPIINFGTQEIQKLLFPLFYLVRNVFHWQSLNLLEDQM